MKKIYKIQYILLVLCVGNLPAIAQTPSVTTIVNRDKVLLGEQIELRIQAVVPDGLPVYELFKLPDTIPHLEILRRGAIDSVIDGVNKRYTQSFTITGFDSGTWTFPAALLKINKSTYRSNPVPITIVPVKLADSTYHDIREIIEVPPPKKEWWQWIAAALSILLVGLLAWLWLKSRKKKGAPVQQSISHAGALEEALEQLRLLEKQQLPEKGEQSAYYSQLSKIVRGYSEKRFGIKALQSTTDELLVQLHSTLKRGQPGMLAELLRISDAVKFAKFKPDTDQSRSDMRNAETILKEMDILK